MREQVSQLVDPVGFRCRSLVRVDPEGRVNAVVRLRDREGAAAGLDARPDGDDARHADGLRPVDE